MNQFALREGGEKNKVNGIESYPAPSKFGCISRHYHSVIVLVSHGREWINGEMYSCPGGDVGVFVEATGGWRLKAVRKSLSRQKIPVRNMTYDL